MATQEQKEELVEILKFTPRTYTMRFWGYGMEHVCGHINQSSPEYLRENDIDFEEAMFMDQDEWVEAGHPLPKHPRMMEEDGEYLTEWSDCDNLGRVWGVEVCDSSYLTIYDENENEVVELNLGSQEIYDNGIEYDWEYECDIDNVELVREKYMPEGRYVVHARSSEKGTFWECELPLTQPLDLSKLELKGYAINEWNACLGAVMYDGEDLDNYGGDTNGKGIEMELIDLEEWV